MDTPGLETAKLVEEFKGACAAGDAARVRAVLNQRPQLKAWIDEPAGPFDAPAIVNVHSRDMLDVLLDAGADINTRSRWWAGGFGLLDSAIRNWRPTPSNEVPSSISMLPPALA